jgi:hypothetical protein
MLSDTLEVLNIITVANITEMHAHQNILLIVQWIAAS